MSLQFINCQHNPKKDKELKPCPECGYPDCYRRKPVKRLFDVFCPHCRFSSNTQTTLKRAVMEWNKLLREERVNND